MAFPTIPTVAAGRVLTAVQANTTATRTFPSLSSLTKNSGDLLIAIIIAYQSSVTNAAFSSWGAGFTEFVDSSTSTTMAIGCAYKFSDGTETGTFTVTQAATITGHATLILLSIAGAHASTPPEGGSRASGTSSAADPGSFDPSGWAAEDTLWIAVAGSGETSTTGSYTGVASAPTNYSDYADTTISGDVVGGCEGAVAFRQLNAASTDVGPFSVDTSNARNAALVLAVRPAAAVDHALAFDMPLGLTIDTALQPTEHPAAFAFPLGLTVDMALQPTEHPAAFDMPLGLTIDTNLQPAEHLLAFDMPLALAIDTNLVTVVDHAISFDMQLGMILDTAMTAELFIAFTQALNLDMQTAATREAFLAFTQDLGITINMAAVRETFAAFDLPLGFDIATNLTVPQNHALAFGMTLGLDIQTSLQGSYEPAAAIGGQARGRSPSRRVDDDDEALAFLLTSL